MSLVKVDELIRALKGCDKSAYVFLSVDEEMNQLKPLDSENIKGLYSGRVMSNDEWEMVGAHLPNKECKYTVLTPVG